MEDLKTLYVLNVKTLEVTPVEISYIEDSFVKSTYSLKPETYDQTLPNSQCNLFCNTFKGRKMGRSESSHT